MNAGRNGRASTQCFARESAKLRAARSSLEVPGQFGYNRRFLNQDRCDVTPLESATQVWRQAVRVLILQAALAGLAAVIATIAWDLSAGVWALAGGAVCVVPAALFAFELSRAARRSSQAFGVALALGELVKVVLVTALFVLAYSRFGGVNAAALLFGFITAIQGYFLALLIN